MIISVNFLYDCFCLVIMVKVSNTIIYSKIPKKDRHIEYNWEKSPDNENMVRNHFVVVDDKKRKGTLNEILNQLVRINSGLVKIRECEGKVENSKLRYLLASYDSVTDPNMIDWSKVKKPVKQNTDLYERESFDGLENYVADRFS